MGGKNIELSLNESNCFSANVDEQVNFYFLK